MSYLTKKDAISLLAGYMYAMSANCDLIKQSHNPSQEEYDKLLNETSDSVAGHAFILAGKDIKKAAQLISDARAFLAESKGEDKYIGMRDIINARPCELMYDDRVNIVSMYMDVCLCLLNETRGHFSDNDQVLMESRVMENISVLLNMMATDSENFDAIRSDALKLMNKKADEQEKPERNIVQIANEIINPKKLS